MNNVSKLIKAMEFAAEKHKLQRRKGYLKIPYINHPLKVCKLIADAGETDINLLLGAVLHDTLEDTDTAEQELFKNFGKEITGLVLEVTDNMKLPDEERKELQVRNSSSLSKNAKLIRIADKIANISDIINYPIKWTKRRKRKYVSWSMKVYEGCKGQNLQLDMKFQEICKKAMEII